METKDRIRLIMEDQHMTQQVFADFLGQSPATLSSIFNGRTRPTLNIVDAIVAKIPDISIEWLLYGKGQMHSSHSTGSDNGVKSGPSASREAVIDFDSAAPGSVQGPQNMPVSAPVYASPAGYNGLQGRAPEVMSVVEHEPRRVTEIRVYYDDYTYETFVPAKER
ncbi:MAG: helix-turn-helix transcriptional regulator [Prevotella sp.]|nr:helix-turn-helix transcriptional regulator [Prevotella sp.]